MQRKERATTETQVRPQRVPVGQRPKLAVVGKDPAFVYRWVNDTPGRIKDFERGGWVLCKNDEVDTGNFRAEEASAMGSFACQVVNGGDGGIAYVMKIAKELYEEDQVAAEDEIRRTEETLRPDTSDGEYGSIRIDRSGRR